MKRLWVLGLLVCFSLVPVAEGGVLNFAGTTTSGTSAANSLAWTLSVVFTPASGAVANISSATLVVGNQTFLRNSAGNADTITVNSVAGVNNDTATLAIDFLQSTPGSLGSAVAILTNLTLNGKVDVPTVANDANIALLAQQNNTVTNGSFILFPGFAGGVDTITLNGSVPAPEPSSVLLLTGLGLVVGRRYLRKMLKK